MTLHTQISDGLSEVVVTPTFNGCTVLFKSWIKRFGKQSILFNVPPHQEKAHPKPLTPTAKTTKGEN
jgi:hypothetical protein